MGLSDIVKPKNISKTLDGGAVAATSLEAPHTCTLIDLNLETCCHINAIKSNLNLKDPRGGCCCRLLLGGYYI